MAAQSILEREIRRIEPRYLQNPVRVLLAERCWALEKCAQLEGEIARLRRERSAEKRKGGEDA